ncbi:hypothetical protein SmJEL517_g01419 [Synchytrium microbalum]|uniref:Tr-type G domain-containing protein n=1 Tax=Synchytrium microbalum TaxID=1806994 RepID=A0A507CEZ8_9FUNG|nr:uncharacterized protein SmJEL517_g01419 [Synchytrium microbalum]TPX36155.1 hypothetical protein SmJEL517_g01419 [Synchytrium microbalum]
MTAASAASLVSSLLLSSKGKSNVQDESIFGSSDFLDGDATGENASQTVASNKALFLTPTPEGLEQIKTSLHSRMEEGQGEFVLEIGLDDEGRSLDLTDDEFNQYVDTVSKTCTLLNATVTILHRRHTPLLPTSSTAAIIAALTDVPPETPAPVTAPPSPYNYAHLLVRQNPGRVEDLLELRVAVVGNVDAGKSTLLGVLTKDLLDDGRGKARVNLFRHKHEIESGRTSSVGMEIMGFDSKGRVLTPSSIGRAKITWEDVCTAGSKVLSFIDLAGHERYLKTTVFGMTGCAPDFVMLLVGSNSGMIGMSKEHLGLALALQVPVFIVVTKIDMAPKNVLEATLRQLIKILKSSGCRKLPMFIKKTEDVLMSANTFVGDRVCPIFQVSNVTGEGLDLLKLFLNILQPNGRGKYQKDQPTEYSISDLFSVPGVGTVVSGTVNSGIVHVGDTLLLGPDSAGHFQPTIVKSIQRKRVNVPCASAGQSASFALKKIKRAAIRKGMVMLSRNADAKAFYEFEAEILVLYHSSTITPRYQAMLHCGGIHQTTKVVGIDRPLFLMRPEFMKVGTRLLFREGRTKGVGKVVRLIPEAESSEALKKAALLPNPITNKPPNHPPHPPFSATASQSSVAPPLVDKRKQISKAAAA